MNRSWNGSNSSKTHKRITENPEEWTRYHTLYRQARKSWTVVPFEELARWAERREGLVIGDFGCGEALFAELVEHKHTIHSFDHIAINDKVIATDICHVPLDDASLDMAVFSLSLMGSNFAEYLKEAYRVLKPDGHIHIVEATSRFKNIDFVRKVFRAIGLRTIQDRVDVRSIHMAAWK